MKKLNVCCGQPDSHFLSMMKAKKGKIISADGNVRAYLNQYAPVIFNENCCYQATVQTMSCELLTTGDKINAYHVRLIVIQYDRYIIDGLGEVQVT